VTTAVGTNRLIGTDMEDLKLHVKRILRGDRPAGGCPPLWDGHASERIAAVLAKVRTS
jgi:UDP-N-acetylglucosamine 2-epimerase (non-hydrolysing)